MQFFFFISDKKFQIAHLTKILSEVSAESESSDNLTYYVMEMFP